MTSLLLPPALLVFAGAGLLALLPRASRVIVLLLPILLLWYIWSLPLGTQLSWTFLDYTLIPLQITATGRLFATIFSIAIWVGSLYALNQARTAELCAALCYAGSAVGVTFAGDLLTLFIYWELMAVGATAVIWTANTKAAWQAGMRYLLVHIFGGVILMIGIAGHVYQTGNILFLPMQVDNWANCLILLAFLINAGAPPFSAWVADAYPESSPSGMVFLSAFTTKTAVFTLMMGFAGNSILIYVGLFMVFYGIIYALLENDMRRILAYSIVNQVGFMVTAIGIGSELALNGAAAHAFAHIIYKALLIMSAGSVLLQTGKRKCSELGGLFQTMPVTSINGSIGALAISAFPFTSGFVTKSLETAAAAEQGLVWVWFLLLAASAGVFLHAGIKFPWFVFFQKDSGLRPTDPPANMQLAMWLFSLLCILLGVFPQLLYAILPYPVDYQPYTAEHLITQTQLLLFAGFAFFALLPLMKRTATITLDFDWFYRKGFAVLIAQLHKQLWHWDSKFSEWFLQKLHKSLNWLATHTPQGILSKTRMISSMVIWVTIILTGYLILSFF